MAMDPDKLSAILKAGPKGPSKGEALKAPSVAEAADTDTDLKTELAADVLDALRSKDPASLADALKAFIEECTGGYASETEE